VFIANGMGDSDTKFLKEKIAKMFPTLTAQMNPLSKINGLYTGGVNLACESSAVLQGFFLLEQKGARLIIMPDLPEYF
jgi:hypothetical protein